MNRSTKLTLISIVALILAMQVGEYLTAPQSLMSYLKSSIAMQRVRDRVVDAYHNGDFQRVNNLTDISTHEMGYGITAVLWKRSEKLNGQVYDVQFLSVWLYHNQNDSSLAVGTYFERGNFSFDGFKPRDRGHMHLKSFRMPMRTMLVELKRTLSETGEYDVDLDSPGLG